jgi:hypothetical protein
LKGSAVKVGSVIACRINFGSIYRCGNTNAPAVHVVGDGVGGFGAARIFDLVLQATHNAPSVKIESGTSAIIQRTHFEANSTESELQQTFVHCSGGCTLLENGFGSRGNNVTQVIYDGTGILPFQRITGNAFQGAGTALVMASAYSQADISTNFFNGAGATANTDSVTINGQLCKLVNNRFYGTGRINLTSDRAEFLDNSLISCTAPSGSALVLCGVYGQIRDNFFDGGGSTAVSAIKPTAGGVKVDNNFIRGLNNVTAIDMSAATALSSLTDNTAIELNGGTAFVYSSGLTASGNIGYPTTANATAGATTLHAESGVVTSEALTTAAGSSYTLTLTNQLMAASSRVQVSVSRGTEADSLSYQVQEVRPAAASCVIVIKNTGSVAFGDAGAGGGTIKIAFTIQN